MSTDDRPRGVALELAPLLTAVDGLRAELEAIAKTIARSDNRPTGGSILDAALNVLERDPHSFSTRPCQTCTAVSSLAGRPFGCSARAAMVPR